MSEPHRANGGALPDARPPAPATGAADSRKPLPSHLAFPVVGIGGSAGALPALLRLFEAMPPEPGMAFVVVIHLSPDHESHVAAILGRATSMPVMQVVEATPLERNRVYVIAPGADLVTRDGHVQPAASHGRRRPSAAIDVFFRALADVHLERAICVVLSGTGTDGALGVGRVKENAGLSIAQAPEDAEFAAMPRAAIDTGCVDLVLPAAEIGARIVELWSHERTVVAHLKSEPAAQVPATDVAQTRGLDGPLNEILSLLRFHTRHDFRHYKRSTVLRRIARRMQINGVGDLAGYRDFLAEHPKEAGPLLQDMLISVTNFFRDPEAFEALRSDVVPLLLEATRSREDLRVWVAGCAGEEAYSIAMVLHEEAARRSVHVNLQIFATDINEGALAIARRGAYPPAIATDVSQARLTQFFETEGGQYRVVQSLRDPLLFAKHNLLGDPPFSRLDLICCRNVLIYLDLVAQAAALETFRYALKPDGFLFLGNSEATDAAGDLFTPFDKAHRIFRAAPSVARIGHVPLHIPSPIVGPPPKATAAPGEGETDASSAALQHQAVLLAVSRPSVLLDARYDVLHMSPGAAEFVGRGDGVPSDNLLASVATDIRVELRAALFKAEQSGSVTRARVVREADGRRQELVIAVYPVPAAAEESARWLLDFEPWREVPGAHARGDQAVSSAADAIVERLEAENRELKEQLQITLERFATSGEEYKAANEELQAINAELRSASEELETSREELESMNEELATVNYELRVKVEDASRINDDLTNLMAAADFATVFVNSGQRIRRFTPAATRLFHLIPSDLGRPLSDIRNRLRFHDPGEDAAIAFKELRVVERLVEGLDGRRYLSRALPYRTTGDKIDGAVLTFVDVSEQHAAQELARESQGRLMRAIHLSEDFAVLTTDEDGVIDSWNAGAEAVFGFRAEAIIGRSIDELFTPVDRAAGVPAQERRTALETGRAADERWHLRADGNAIYCSGVVTPLRSDAGTGFVKIARDASAGQQLAISKDLALSDEKRLSATARIAGDLKDRFLAVMSHELKQPLNLIQVNAELLTRLPEARRIEPVMRIGQTIQPAVAVQTKIVNDLLDLSRIQTGKLSLAFEDVDLVELTRMLGQAASGDLEGKGIAFTMALGTTPIVCHCDRVRIEQVVWNLLGNAAKFTPAGGRIDIELSAEGGHARLSIADSGAGIALEFLPHVFDLFSQGSQPATVSAAGGGGLGIGLALVDELVRAHGGRVEVQSKGPGRGSTFVVSLPLRDFVPLPAPAAPAARVGVAGARILAVDDHADSLSAFAMLLQLEGAIVDTAADGAEALQLLATRSYDVLISDVSMPVMDGLQLIAAARKLPAQRKLLAIAITGFGRDVDVRNALQAGFDAHLSKPVTMAQLQAALDAH